MMRGPIRSPEQTRGAPVNCVRYLSCLVTAIMAAGGDFEGDSVRPPAAPADPGAASG